MQFTTDLRVASKLIICALMIFGGVSSASSTPAEDDQVVITNSINYMTLKERAQWEKELGRAKKTITAANQPVQLALEAAEKEAADLADPTTVSGCQKQVNGFLKSSPIVFLPGRFSLTKSEKNHIKGLAKVLASCETAKVLIEGHTDDRGQPEANQRLSGERANSVLNLLVNSGIKKNRVRAIGYGADKPIVNNDTVESRAHNRRIELKLY